MEKYDARKGKLQEKKFEGREFQTKINGQESKPHFYEWKSSLLKGQKVRYI